MKRLPTFKKVLLQTATLACCLMLCMFMGCNNDDEDPTASDLIIGEWTISTTTLVMSFNGKDLTQYLMSDLGFTQDEAVMFADMLEDMILEYFVGTIEFKNDKTTVYNIGGDSDTGQWSMSNDGKTLYLDEGTIDEMVVHILELTSTRLKIEMTQSEEVDIDEDGDDDEITTKITITLTK